MTVCFEFNPKTQPWITPFDRRDTMNNPTPDNKISTYDVAQVWNGYRGISFTRSKQAWDQSQCDAFYTEMMKLRFYTNVIEAHGWQAGIFAATEAASTQVNYVFAQEIGNWQKITERTGNDVEEYTCGMFGDCDKSYFTSAREFLRCAADAVVENIKSGKRSLASVGIQIKQAENGYPQIDYVIPEANNAMHGELRNLTFSYITSINGQPTKGKNVAEVEAMLAGPEGTFVKMGIADYKDVPDQPCQFEPRNFITVAMQRNLRFGEVMTKCGGLTL